jgi:predicted metal-dependent HD superfamily phosphohydrolase
VPESLESRCDALWRRLGGAGPGPYADLARRYAEAHRAYHTIEHIAHCLDEADAVGAPDVVRLALWYHDAVYDTKRSDNEERSAELVRALPLPAAIRERAAALVLATKHAGIPEDPEAALTVDIDLAILGRPPADFDRYERQIRTEYAWVPGMFFRSKRAEILASFLARPSIYGTPRFRDRYEAAARANLERSLAALR